MSSASPENHPSSFPPLLTALDFILLADGGVPGIAQIREYLWHTIEQFKSRGKDKYNKLFV